MLLDALAALNIPTPDGAAVTKLHAEPAHTWRSEMQSDSPHEVVWRVLEGPDAWIDTVITFALQPSTSGGTTLLFTHARWAQASEFMSGCSTNWGAYLTSLKTGAEGVEFRPYPQGEISRWA
ncbi:MAG: hypothetical protein QOG22_3758 [Pseudonocardiales bacterium]|nr:hypothetical protein [Pseudonocardiales bacterium]